MSVQRVVLTSPEEQHEPPNREVDLEVIGDLLFVTVYEGSDRDVPSSRKEAYSVPPLDVRDLLAALGAFAYSPPRSSAPKQEAG